MSDSHDSVDGGVVVARVEADNAALHDALCGICYTLVDPLDNPRGRLNSCEHLFCAYCIKQWAKNTNVCPLCKARFTRIYTQLPGGNGAVEETKVRRRNYKAWEEDEDDEDGEDDAAGGGGSDAEDVDDGDVVRRAAQQLQQQQRRRRRRHRATADGGGSNDADDDDDDDATPTVRCAVCHSSANASRMIFCDRRVCSYAAHLDCIGYRERPLTFVCPTCTTLLHANSSSSSSSSSSNSSLVTASPVLTPTTDGVTCAATPAPSPSARAPRTMLIGCKMPMHADAAMAAWLRSQHLPLRSSSSSRSSNNNNNTHDAAPTTTACTRTLRVAAAVNDAPIDFAQCHLPPPPTTRSRHTTSSTTTAAAAAAAAAATTSRSSSRGRNARTGDTATTDDLYFLHPTTHAQQAWQQLMQQRATRACEAQQQRARLQARARRLGITLADTTATTTTVAASGRRRGRHAATGTTAAAGELAAALREEQLARDADVYANANSRAALEDRLTHAWATELLPILRRNDDVAHQQLRMGADMRVLAARPPTSAQEQAREQALWQQAMQQAREQVRTKMDATALQLRRQREHLVQLRAVREAAALAKLARVIALHRQQQGQEQQQQLGGQHEQQQQHA